MTPVPGSSDVVNQVGEKMGNLTLKQVGKWNCLIGSGRSAARKLKGGSDGSDAGVAGMIFAKMFDPKKGFDATALRWFSVNQLTELGKKLEKNRDALLHDQKQTIGDLVEKALLVAQAKGHGKGKKEAIAGLLLQLFPDVSGVKAHINGTLGGKQSVEWPEISLPPTVVPQPLIPPPPPGPPPPVPQQPSEAQYLGVPPPSDVPPPPTLTSVPSDFSRTEGTSPGGWLGRPPPSSMPPLRPGAEKQGETPPPSTSNVNEYIQRMAQIASLSVDEEGAALQKILEDVGKTGDNELISQVKQAVDERNTFLKGYPKTPPPPIPGAHQKLQETEQKVHGEVDWKAELAEVEAAKNADELKVVEEKMKAKAKSTGGPVPQKVWDKVLEKRAALKKPQAGQSKAQTEKKPEEKAETVKTAAKPTGGPSGLDPIEELKMKFAAKGQQGMTAATTAEKGDTVSSQVAGGKEIKEQISIEATKTQAWLQAIKEAKNEEQFNQLMTSIHNELKGGVLPEAVSNASKLRGRVLAFEDIKGPEDAEKFARVDKRITSELKNQPLPQEVSSARAQARIRAGIVAKKPQGPAVQQALHPTVGVPTKQLTPEVAEAIQAALKDADALKALIASHITKEATKAEKEMQEKLQELQGLRDTSVEQLKPQERMPHRKKIADMEREIKDRYSAQSDYVGFYKAVAKERERVVRLAMQHSIPKPPNVDDTTWESSIQTATLPGQPLRSLFEEYWKRSTFTQTT